MIGNEEFQLGLSEWKFDELFEELEVATGKKQLLTICVHG